MDVHMPALRALGDAQRVERAQLARVVQLQAIDRLMKTMERLAAFGFAPIGFCQPSPDGGLTIKVEAPSDRMVDAARGNGVMGGRFAAEQNQRWFLFDGVRVLWDVLGTEEKV